MEIDLTNKENLKKVLDSYFVNPKKSLGQNFVIDKSVVKKICDSADLSKKDEVVEVGPGIGTLTLPLAKKAKRVTAVEKDRRLVSVLRDLIKNKENIKIIHEDILSFPVPFRDYKVVANLPYYITSPVIRKFLEERCPPSSLVLTVQREVAERIIAKPPNMSVLSVSVQFYARPEIVSHVSRNSFWPSPSVESSIIKITPKEEIFDEEFKKDFFRIVKKGFSHPRKQILTNFQFDIKGKKGLNLIKKEELYSLIKESGVDPKSRAEKLSIKEWKLLVKVLKNVI